MRGIYGVFFFLFLLGFAGFLPERDDFRGAGSAGGSPDYRDTALWYIRAGGEEPGVDVFYITPTCVRDFRESNGRLSHHMDVHDREQRGRVKREMLLAGSIFNGCGRFYSPYYRQVTLEAWTLPDSLVERKFAVAMQDIGAAFDHYMEHYNGGRPFIIAGFSQGGKAVAELVKKKINKDNYRRFIAGYVAGYRVTAEDMAASRYMKPAKDSLDLGVLICYNSVTDTAAVLKRQMAGNILCINPVNWRTDDVPGYLPGRKEVSVKLDTVKKVLVVSGLDPGEYYHKSLEFLFPRGVLHLGELRIYRECLSRNARQRGLQYYKR